MEKMINLRMFLFPQLNRSHVNRAVYNAVVRTSIRNCCTEKLILTKEEGNNAVVIINRPKSMNAMNVEVQSEFLRTLQNLESKKSLIIIKGAGDTAFSAGGDLLALSDAGRRNDEKYICDMLLYTTGLIYSIYKYKIPVISLMNGITFGGGMGVSYFTKYKIVTEKTRISMPESKIAFHPNSAASYFFNRSPGKLGYYLALTGNSLDGSDILRAGYATHYCVSEKLPKLEQELMSSSSEQNAKDILENMCEKDIPEFSLAPVMDSINKCFSEDTVEDIIEKLRQEESVWAEETLKTLAPYSPTCLKVILEQLKRTQNMNVLDCLVIEGSIGINFFKNKDVYEGIRTRLRDRSDTPKWDPPKLSEVTQKMVDDYFLPVVEKKQREFLKQIDSN